MTEKRFEMGDYTNCQYNICEILKNGEYYCTVATEDADLIINVLEENEQLKQFQEKVAEVIEGKMEDNVCNDYKMEVLKEIWNELELDEVWFE